MKISIAIILMALLSGCMASMSERHYILAHDPATSASNFFRIDFRGRSFFSRAKFSLGRYDRSAVDQLFSENDIQRQYLSERIDVYENGQRIADLSSVLQSSKDASAAKRKEALFNLNSSLQELIGEVRLEIETGTAGVNKLLPIMGKIEEERAKGEVALIAGTNADIIKASSHLRNTLGAMNTLRKIVNGNRSVRFFDADGNELDVVNMSTLVFVATDSSKFTNALSQVVESENAQRDLFVALTADDVNEQNLLAEQVNSSNKINKALVTRITGLIDSSASSTDEQEQAILQIAKEVAGKVNVFADAGEIRTFVQALGDE